MVDRHVGMYAHHHYRDGQSSAGVTLQHMFWGALEDVKCELGERSLVQDRHRAMQTNCDRQPTAVQP